MSAPFDAIADFIQTPRVPASTRDMAALLLIDTLAVAAGATDIEPAIIARDFAVAFQNAPHPDDQARLLFDGRKSSLCGAAFAAATQIDNLDGHDGYNPTKGHIGCAVVPALLAFAEQSPDLKSVEALDILAMSYEIAARAAIALHATVSDYHTSGAWNGIAVAAIGCTLRNASKEQLRHAIGIAEYHGPRSQMMREIATPTMLHDGSGMGALTGSMAALLALRGFTGAPAITLENPDVQEHWRDLGQTWTIERNYIKPYPVCRWAHAPLDGLALLMRENTFAAGDVKNIKVRTFSESAALFPDIPMTTSQAQYSLRFSLASMLHHKVVGPDQINSKGLTDKAVHALMPMIDIVEDAVHSDRFPAKRCADITVTLQDGTTLFSGDVEARGGPEAPLSEQEVEAKVHLFADRVIGAPQADRLWQMRSDMLHPDHMFRYLIDLATTKAN